MGDPFTLYGVNVQDQLMKILGEARLFLENENEMYHLVTVSWDQYGLKKGGGS